METVRDFVNALVKIEKQHGTLYGHNPFQLFAEMPDGKNELAAMSLNGVADYYKIAAKYYKMKAKRIYMSIDFPKGGDIETDFVVIYSITQNELELFAIPYDNLTGERFKEITESYTLSIINKEFLATLKHLVQSEFKIN